MTETEDCEGRTKFYDEYGVLRDVHQNHLSEMAALIAMSLPEKKGEEVNRQSIEWSRQLQREREKVLREAKAVELSDTWLGQYKGYKDHVQKDHRDGSKVTTNKIKGKERK